MQTRSSSTIAIAVKRTRTTMALIRRMLAAAVLSLLYGGPTFAADTISKDQQATQKGRAGGPTGWEGPRVDQGSVAADSISKDEYKAEKQRIHAESNAAREKCNSMPGNAKDTCMAQAKTHEKAATAELEARQKDSAKARKNVQVAIARDYDTAKKKCNELSGEDRTACLKQAKAAQNNAKTKARAERDADAGKERTSSATGKSTASK
jgi:hypothetical protein